MNYYKYNVMKTTSRRLFAFNFNILVRTTSIFLAPMRHIFSDRDSRFFFSIGIPIKVENWPRLSHSTHTIQRKTIGTFAHFGVFIVNTGGIRFLPLTVHLTLKKYPWIFRPFRRELMVVNINKNLLLCAKSKQIRQRSRDFGFFSDKIRFDFQRSLGQMLDQDIPRLFT